MKTKTNRPKLEVGAPWNVRGAACKIVKVWPFGTIDVVSLDGKSAYRVTGLIWA